MAPSFLLLFNWTVVFVIENKRNVDIMNKLNQDKIVDEIKNYQQN